ncbi:HlyD family efflux transporter periplasmic adaptor subunit [Desulfobacterales bacterium HSG17]|nr:HlyD family efflux transporter periplasmic adaptor subunit [Desulfobacterales bacterium HSG17]
MQNSLYPTDILGYTAEHVLSRHSARGHLIYCILVLTVIAALSLLPVLKVTVSVQSNGIIRPLTEKNEVKLLVSGSVSGIFVEENQTIEKDQTILALDTSVSDEKLKLITYEGKEQEQLAHDLNLLTSASPKFSIKTKRFKTIHYKSEYLLFKNQLKENKFNREKAKKESKRYKMLKNNKLATLSDLENKELELAKLKIQREMLIDQHIAKWNKELLSSQLKLKQLKTQKEQIQKEKEFSTVKSPISGTVEQFSGISTGSYVQTGQLLAVISPDSDLQVEVYVSPYDIGLIKIGTKANIQIDAFDYNQWGLISGSVIKISDDFIPMDNQPFFRVRCRLDQTWLQLKNGYKGHLKKGMTVRTRFLVTKRSLFQLLYDKIDDWLNPLQKNV